MKVKIAKVKFYKKGKLYNYICDIEDVIPGDIVTVQTSRKIQAVEVVSVSYEDIDDKNLISYHHINSKINDVPLIKFDVVELEQYVDKILNEYEVKMSSKENLANFQDVNNYRELADNFLAKETEDSKQGEYCLSNFEPKKGLGYLYKAVLEGNLFSLSWIADELYNGDNIQINEKLAFKCYKILSLLGDADSMVQIGDIYKDMKEYDKAVLCYYKAYDAGCVDAFIYLDDIELKVSKEVLFRMLPDIKKIKRDTDIEIYTMLKVLHLI